jgi:hypothetical protein
MKDFGLHMIGKGLVNATFNEMDSPYNHAMSVVHIAHGAELVIKSRIAEEHSLLIFSNIPKSNSLTNEKLGLADLLNDGHSIMYSELPDRLWQTTGYKIKNLELNKKFGKIRNQIIHLGVPNIELSELALKFGYEVVEVLVNDWWDCTLLEYAKIYDDTYLENVFELTDSMKIKLNYELDENYNLIKK